MNNEMRTEKDRTLNRKKEKKDKPGSKGLNLLKRESSEATVTFQKATFPERH